MATGGLANNANQQAFGEANEINQEENQEQSDIAGGIASLATAGATFGLGAAGFGGGPGGITGGLSSLFGMSPPSKSGGGSSDMSQFGAVIP